LQNSWSLSKPDNSQAHLAVAPATTGSFHPPPALNPPSILPPSILLQLDSAVDQIDLKAIFPTPQPVEVELGSGDGSWLIEYARLHPERNFLGVERLFGRLRKIGRKGTRAGLRNLRGLRLEAGYCLEYLLPPQSVQALHIYFPDPWPKRRHWGRRLVGERFPSLASRVLVPGGVIYLRTDSSEYFAQMQAVLGGQAAFQPTETPPELAAIHTDFERDFLRQGISAFSAAFKTLNDGNKAPA